MVTAYLNAFQFCSTEFSHGLDANILDDDLAMNLYSRQYNVRFFNILVDSSKDCIKKLQSILSDDLGIKTSIENAHRIG